MILLQLRGLLLSSTKLETRKRVVGCLIYQGKMNMLDIIKMTTFLGSPLKSGFAVYNLVAQNKWRGLSLARSFYLYLKVILRQED
uniref:Uncharacterized protein n=1 Tax=Brassica oleracea var. oleracea TaxID=109376 RepID=A0A0D3BDB7_BRAOL